jgi:cytoskeleton protein RodZ
VTDAAAGGEGVRGIGARLRSAREQRALTILQAAEKLHVDPRVLDALESEDFSSLGADVFVRGHLRRYA